MRMMKAFFESAKLANNKTVLEFRDPSWWKEVKRIAKMGVVFCFVDAPCLPNEIITTNNAAYLRLHRSKEWYSYLYSEKELDKILTKVKKLKAKKKVVYLNNDHGMLKNGLYLLQRI